MPANKAPAVLVPVKEYQQRLSSRQAERERLARRWQRLRRVRNVLLGVVIVLAVLSDKERLLGKVMVLAGPALLVEWVARRRIRVGQAWRRVEQAIDFYERRLACATGAWAGSGSPGTRYLDERHPCAPDLDLFGPGCLFERLSTAHTRPGEDTLAAWLLAPASPEEVRQRQAAVAELRDRLDLREELALLGAEVEGEADFSRFVEWGKSAATLSAPVVRWAILGGTALALLGLGIYVFAATSPWPIFAALLVQGALTLALRHRITAILVPVEDRASALPPLAALLARLEKEPFQGARLQRLRAALTDEPGPASRRLFTLGRLLSRAPWMHLLLARPQMALLVEGWRNRSGAAMGRWLDALGELEALCALAAYAFEEPDDPFPEVVGEGPCFAAEGLGHPLLPRDRCVRNDVALGTGVSLLVISGSNMSGKSTLLRAIGTNAILALAGAPVRAVRLRLSPLVVGATLRIQDSLQAGRSRFYAEVLRVRQLLDLARGAPPLLFLLDELFQGTNSADRRVGAEAVIRRLLDAGALGLVTTHDLALTEIAERLRPRAANVHFEDRFEGAEMTFDYRMRPGVVQNTNGLALMRAVGIEIE
jgi:hypothetical protein